MLWLVAGGPSPFKYLSPWGQMMMAGIADLIFQRCSLADILAGVRAAAMRVVRAH